MVAPALVLVGATGTFAVVAGVVVAAGARSSSLRRGPTILAVLGIGWLLVVGVLWLDGRIGRYFTAAFWPVVAAGLIVGVAVGRGRVDSVPATAVWTAIFAVTFATHLPFGVDLGPAAVLGHAVETVTVVFVALPGVLVGAGVGARGRKHLLAATER